MGTAFSSDFFSTEPGTALILSGGVSASRGAFEAGVGFVVTYPGSPVVEAFEVLASRDGPLYERAHVVINEHVAFHKALGYSLAGGRSLAVMKHVGLNVASDPVHYAGYTGVRGGMVVLVGFDPGANCSTGEFDCRLYSLHTHLPILEPGDFQEALDMTREAFTLSEELSLPVMIFLPSSFCYGMGTVVAGEVKGPNENLGFTHTPDLTNVGPRAVARHKLLHEKISRLENDDRSGSIPGLPDDHRHLVAAKDLVVTSGIHRDFVLEALEILGARDRVAVYAPAGTYPLSRPGLLSAIEATGCERLVFVEDLEGLLEMQACTILAKRGLTPGIVGKDYFPPYGSLSFQQVLEGLAHILGLESSTSLEAGREESRERGGEERGEGSSEQGSEVLDALPREGTFCPGCPHRAFFYTLLDILDEEDIIGGDIGCSSLPPHFSDWLTCMNSGPSIAAGVVQALDDPVGRREKEKEGGGTRGRGRPRVLSCIGDSTLFHGGIQTIIECAQKDSNQLCFVLDNSWTAMTGHQCTPATRKDLAGNRLEGAIDIEALLKACGVKRVVRADPCRVSQMRRIILKLLDQEGFSCVVVVKECKLQEKRRGEVADWESRFAIIADRCRKCNKCYSILTCPAISKDVDDVIRIDPDVCTGCSVCRQICPNGAIVHLQQRRQDGGPEGGA